MKKKKTNKKIASALAMLMLSAAMLGTSTYAWFTMNKKVTVTGMEVKTHVGSNLLIAEDTLASTAKKADSYFGTVVNTQFHEILEPVSTIDGENFFYTLDAKADGSKLNATSTTPYIAYDANGGTATDSTNYLNKFSEDYKLNKTTAAQIYADKQGAVGYVDYVFQLKATNTNASASEDIQITKMDLTYADGTDTDNAFRAAVFVEDITSGTSAGSVGTLKGIYKPAAGAYFDNTAVKSTTDKDTPNLVTTSAVAVGSVAANSIKYYKVVVRLYIEGEDTTCKTDVFKALTNAWGLSLELELGGTGTTVLNMLPARSGS